MDRSEFNQWAREYGRNFPSIAKWLNDLGAETKKVQVDNWATILRRVDKQDADEVTRLMVLGEIPAIGTTNSGREGLALTIKDHAVRLSFSRKLTPVEDDLRHAVRCQICNDGGIVVVWSFLSMKAYRDGSIDKRTKRRDMAVPCSCNAGSRYIHPEAANDRRRRGTWTSDSIRYDVTRYCLVHPRFGLFTDEGLDDFKEWCKDFFNHYEERRAARLAEDLNVRQYPKALTDGGRQQQGV